MRLVLPTKPLASAMRYGPFLAGHWKYLVLASQGLKQAGFSPGPLTTAGPAAMTAPVARHAATAAAKRVRMIIAVSFGGLGRGDRPTDEQCRAPPARRPARKGPGH